MAALEQRIVSTSVNGDVDVSLDVPGDMSEVDVIDEEDIQKEVRTFDAIGDGSPFATGTVSPLLQRGVLSDGWPAGYVWGSCP